MRDPCWDLTPLLDGMPLVGRTFRDELFCWPDLFMEGPTLLQNHVKDQECVTNRVIHHYDRHICNRFSRAPPNFEQTPKSSYTLLTPSRW
ncbi:hypothetical protein CDAR_585761 [Caerostris darwini]|uniref:Uncharacterized protein n=1 Tax=Caerostris darwini TaxID=1538125 RepID=A0AAV4TIF7_9ARAC|nr:hypothetical protein CDAR_585761 [Caerostris darwini]